MQADREKRARSEGCFPAPAVIAPSCSDTYRWRCALFSVAAMCLQAFFTAVISNMLIAPWTVLRGSREYTSCDESTRESVTFTTASFFF